MRMYSLRLLWLSGIVVLSAVILYSCQDDPTSPTSISQEPTAKELRSTKELVSREVAKNLALNIQSVALKNFIKEQSLKRFNGEDNFLIATHLDQVIQLDNGRIESKSLKEIISRNSDASRTSTSLIDSLSEFSPRLQVSVFLPEGTSLEDWDTSTTPKVAYVFSGDSVAPAFDYEGNYYEFTEEPDEVVIVISENEMIVALTSTEVSTISCQALIDLPPYFSTEYHTLYLTTNYYDALNSCVLKELEEGQTNESGRIALPCDRDNSGTKDELWRIKFTTGAAFDNAKKDEGLFNYTLEIRVDILFGQANGSISRLTKVFQTKQNNLDGRKWFGTFAEVITWDKAIYGDAMLYSWLEDDGDNTETTTVVWQSKFDPNNTLTFTSQYNIPKKRCDLGQSIPEYCDITVGDGSTYNTGSITFQVRDKIN